MKIVAISDVHEQWETGLIKIPECDILISAGDMTFSGEPAKLQSFNNWFGKQPVKYKIGIAGNHDITLDWESELIEKHWLKQNNVRTHEERKILAEAMIDLFEDFDYLYDQETIIQGCKIYGTPWNKLFYNWAFNAEEQVLASKYSWIPKDTNILVTHEPPYGIGDLSGHDHVGSTSLLDKVKEIKPDIHIFGHCHEGYGVYKVGPTVFINAAILNRAYKVANRPVEINL